jgi:oligogalacturonide lyase
VASGRIYPSEKREFEDLETGAQVVQLTNWRGHSNHLYFTTTSFLPGGREVVVASDRDNCQSLFRLRVDTGEIVQLTDADAHVDGLSACTSPVRREVYFFEDHDLKAADVDSLEVTPIYRVPADRVPSILTPSCDGRLLAFAERTDIGWEIGPQYQGFEQMLAESPPTTIRVVEIATGRNWPAAEAPAWCSHVNFSPTRPEWICYCHEGPWQLVKQRMWMVTEGGGKHYPLRPQEEDDSVGHEYWLRDGDRVAFHNWQRNKGHLMGWIAYDNTGLVELPFAHGSSHFQSNSDNSVQVGDGSVDGPYILLWHIADGVGEPCKLVRHQSSFHIQRAHPHPIFSPDDDWILYTSDATGYCNVYMARVGSQSR